MAAAVAYASSYPHFAYSYRLPPPLFFSSRCCSSSSNSSTSRNPSSKPLMASGAASAALLVGGACLGAVSLPLGASAALPVLQEPVNALSLPTWAVHVSSVVEWITAMALVWEYGERSGFEAWKGLSWGMVPLLGGAMCACTWHFFYNSESLEVLVALQGALTLIGNFTMCIAAFRIFKASEKSSDNP